ncbi:MAG: tetratricopeptide repeat protein, partial [Spirochaetales bacterium]|nr:tetratricopeptide repeat protein [Spirochaetales bacterium]
MQGELTNYLPDIFRIENQDEEGSKRENEYYFYKPFVFKSIYTIHPPVGFSLRKLPESETLELGSITVEKSYELNDGVVTARFSIDSGKRLLSPEEFDRTKKAVIKFSGENPVLLVFDHIGEKLLSEGDYRGSIDYLKKISEENPGKEIHLIRLADALLKAGLGLDAKKAALRAVAINDESEIAYSKLAWILQHDELGRRLGPGYDRTGAIEAYRKAIELDGEEWSNFANLAILLEYDSNGLRYNSGDLAEAVEIYKLIGDKLSENGMDLNVLTDLLYLKDWEQLEEALGEIKNQKTVTLYKVVLYAAKGDFTAALGEASKTGNNQDKQTLLSNAGELLIHIRNYKSAAVLFREAAKGSGDSISLESRADVLTGTVLNENITFDPENPEDLIKNFYRILYLSGGTDFQELKNLLTDDLYSKAMDRDSRNNFISQWWVLRNESIRAGLSLNVVLDLFLSNLKFQTRTDGEGGYHLKLIETGLNTNIDSNFYIQRIAGSLRVAGTDNFRAPVGAVILDYLNTGKIQSAADWLDWYYKDYSYFGRSGDEPLYGQPVQGFWKQRGNDL